MDVYLRLSRVLKAKIVDNREVRIKHYNFKVGVKTWMKTIVKCLGELHCDPVIGFLYAGWGFDNL